MEKFGQIKIDFEKFKKLKRKLGLKESKLIDVKQMEENLKKLQKLYK